MSSTTSIILRFKNYISHHASSTVSIILHFRVHFRSFQLVLDDDVEEYSEDEEADDDVEFDGDADERSEGEGERRAQALQHAEVLEGHVMLVWAAQVHQTWGGKIP